VIAFQTEDLRDPLSEGVSREQGILEGRRKIRGSREGLLRKKKGTTLVISLSTSILQARKGNRGKNRDRKELEDSGYKNRLSATYELGH